MECRVFSTKRHVGTSYKWNNRVFYYHENLLRRWYNSRLRYCAIGRCLKDRLPIIFRFWFVSLLYDCQCVLAVQNHHHTTEIITNFKTDMFLDSRPCSKWSCFPQKTLRNFSMTITSITHEIGITQSFVCDLIEIQSIDSSEEPWCSLQC